VKPSGLREADRRTLCESPGPIFRRLGTAFRDLVAREAQCAAMV